MIGICLVILYFVIAASTAIACRFLIKIPNEVFRKILHCILLGSLLIFVFGFSDWWVSALASLGFAIAVYPVLVFFERYETFSRLTTERKKGELKNSLLLVFSMFAVVIAICWGWLNDKYLVLAAIYAWGFGDAAAALVGTRFGKHKITWKHVDNKKSIEGSMAMFITSFISVLIIFMLRGGLPPAGYVIVPLGTALAGTLAELYSKKGMDTVICPISSMIILILLVRLFGGL